MSAVQSHLLVRQKTERFGRTDVYYSANDLTSFTKYVEQADRFQSLDEIEYLLHFAEKRQRYLGSLEVLIALDPERGALLC